MTGERGEQRQVGASLGGRAEARVHRVPPVLGGACEPQRCDGAVRAVGEPGVIRPEPRWRWIAPHAIAFDGFRWHARAFCFGDEVFKDFLLSRILDIHGSRASDVMAEDDQDWHTFAKLEIGPHPALSETQAKVIALDYGMSGGKAEITVRRALLYYALRRLGLDTDPAARKPHEQQIVILNHEAVTAGDDHAFKVQGQT